MDRLRLPRVEAFQVTDLVATDLERKMVLLTGPRQVGKTTLCRQLMQFA